MVDRHDGEEPRNPIGATLASSRFFRSAPRTLGKPEPEPLSVNFHLAQRIMAAAHEIEDIACEMERCGLVEEARDFRGLLPRIHGAAQTVARSHISRPQT